MGCLTLTVRVVVRRHQPGFVRQRVAVVRLHQQEVRIVAAGASAVLMFAIHFESHCSVTLPKGVGAIVGTKCDDVTRRVVNREVAEARHSLS